MEEEYWRQRSRVNWLLNGDANTAFFHAIANGRRRKCSITHLVSDQGIITEPLAIQEHVYGFYRDLLGDEGERGLLSLSLTPSAKILYRIGSVFEISHTVFRIYFSADCFLDIIF